jgi:hypothetical protein
MATIIRTVHWTVLPRVGDPVALIVDAVKKTDFTVTSASPEAITIDVPRAIMKNRWAASIRGSLASNGKGGTDITWTVDGPGDKHYEHMAKIAEGLPDGALDDHGIAAAAANVSGKVFGRKEIRHLANVLDPGEQVHAIGVGSLDNKMGIAALTDQRLLFLEKSMLGTESLVDFSLESIGAVSLSKKMTGETLTITHSGTSAQISNMGHGQGDSIVQQFRRLKSPSVLPAPSPAPAAADPIEQLRRLAELRDQGVLTEEEFRAKKAKLLAEM